MHERLWKLQNRKKALEAEKPKESSPAVQKQNLICSKTNLATLLTQFVEKLIQRTLETLEAAKAKEALEAEKQKESLLQTQNLISSETDLQSKQHSLNKD